MTKETTKLKSAKPKTLPEVRKHPILLDDTDTFEFTYNSDNTVNLHKTVENNLKPKATNPKDT